LEQARRKLGAILWRDSVIFGENFSDGRILSAILLESRSKLSHLGRRADHTLIIKANITISQAKSSNQKNSNIYGIRLLQLLGMQML
jgi:hypothetical protein